MCWNLAIALISLMFFTSGCSLEASLQDLAGLKTPKLPPGIEIAERPVKGVITDPAKADFAKSEIYVGSNGKADGRTELEFVIQLMNSDDTVVAGFVPEFTITQGTGVYPLTCSASDEFGISICSLRATDPGIKTVSVNNLGMALSQNVVFDAITKESTQIVSAGGDITVASDPKGWRMTGTVGTQYDRAEVKKDGYKLRLGAGGAAID
ncbi:hypothetical protein EZJ49_07155 [Bdellovibrio bacteriovorus]|uniref:hypothetical protein n=1 Tax=Bdellovibrio bacteriovorus TaxID=959 RepID=UPI0021D25623|nr:hypothetical protein [Bdellovibrio bacteriovorus]UXR66024.1 hypothetical protein EZJ49_07155 [Bdellovibrio bacteriovorus]